MGNELSCGGCGSTSVAADDGRLGYCVVCSARLSRCRFRDEVHGSKLTVCPAALKERVRYVSTLFFFECMQHGGTRTACLGPRRWHRPEAARCGCKTCRTRSRRGCSGSSASPQSWLAERRLGSIFSHTPPKPKLIGIALKGVSPASRFMCVHGFVLRTRFPPGGGGEGSAHRGRVGRGARGRGAGVVIGSLYRAAPGVRDS